MVDVKWRRTYLVSLLILSVDESSRLYMRRPSRVRDSPLMLPLYRWCNSLTRILSDLIRPIVPSRVTHGLECAVFESPDNTQVRRPKVLCYYPRCQRGPQDSNDKAYECQNRLRCGKYFFLFVLWPSLNHSTMLRCSCNFCPLRFNSI
jgi:hypothetical protein